MQVGVSSCVESKVLRAAGLPRNSCCVLDYPLQRSVLAYHGDLIHLGFLALARFNRSGHRINGDRKRESNGWELVGIKAVPILLMLLASASSTKKFASASAFLGAAVANFKSLSFAVTLGMPDKGSCYTASSCRDSCKHLALRHIRTRPFTSESIGKAECLIKPIIA